MPGHTSAHERASNKKSRTTNTSIGPKNSPFSSGFKGASKTSSKINTTNNRETYRTSKTYKTSVSKETLAANKKALEKAKMKKDMEDFANLTYQPPKFTGPAGAIYSGLLGEKTFNVNKEYYTRNVIGKINPKTGQAYGGTVEDFKTYMKGRGSGDLDAMGRTINRDNDVGRSDTGGRVVIEKKVGGSTILTETKTEAEKTAEAKQDEEYDARKTKRRGRRRTILTSQTGATGNLELGKKSLLGV
jgi:hypothetical protein|tara:strand:- start:423 stop:1157 length:735 start_codon:yes stop_codon:yes gene_type:complete